MMMRACLLLGAILTKTQADVATFTANDGQLTTSDVATCAINGVEAADELVNSVLFIWQASSRCGRASSAACSVDVNSAIESVTGMINVILKAVQRCGGVLQGVKERCGLAAGEVTQSLAGVAASASGIAENCHKGDVKPTVGLAHEFLVGSNHMTPKLASCVVDIKSMTKAVLKASLGFATVKMNCDESKGACEQNVLYIVSAMAELGEYIAGVVGHCSTPTNHHAACASDILGLLRNLAHLSASGTELGEACALTAAERLYLETGSSAQAEDDTKTRSLSIALAALLPITAVLSFVGGRRMAKSRPPAQDAEMLVSGEE